MQLKKFLICPKCQDNGLFKPLGELDEFGRLKIKRRIDYTIIDGAEYNVICGNCGEIVFMKRVIIEERRINSEIPYFGGTRFPGSSLMPGTA
jgi:hypothetical protein